MKAVLRKVIKYLRGPLYYQRVRAKGTEERWELIRSRINGAESLLDIGCNIGVLTAMAAAAGLFALGVEAEWDAVCAARRKCKANVPLAYMHLTVTPANVTVLPTADIILCLSVYQKWYKEFGHDGAQHILRTLARKAQRFIFFEPASRKSKYGRMPPDFVDQDLDSIVKYNLAMLREACGGAKVEFVGATAASRGEKFRCLFVVETGALDGQLDQAASRFADS
jgi:SAM-dependent methyltransferase